MNAMRTNKTVNDCVVPNDVVIRTSRIWYLTGKRHNARHSPERGIPGGDLWAFDTMSRRVSPASADTKAGK